MAEPQGGHQAHAGPSLSDVGTSEEPGLSSLLQREGSFSERRMRRREADTSQPDERLGHLHARRHSTTDDGLSVTVAPLARPAVTANSQRAPSLPKVRRAALTQSDAKLYAQTQGLVPMMNTPHSTPSSALQSIGTVCWPFQKDMELSLVVPPLPPGLLPDVRPQDFNLYKQRFASRLARFEAARGSQFVPRVDSEDFIPGQSQHIAGEGLVQAMRAVPLEFFAEDFSLQKPQIWQALCGTGDDKDRTEKMDLYANHLDTVETHLLQEIAARSSHFFEAAGIVQDLRGTLTRTYQQIAGLREQIGNLKGESGGAVATQQHLQRRRKNLIKVLDNVKVLEGITAAQEALELLLPAGDFAGALDVLGDLTAAGAPLHVTGLHAFRDLPQQLAACEESVNGMMAAEFLRVTQCTELDAAMDAALSSLQPSRTASSGNLQSSARERLISDPSSRTLDRAKLYKEEALLDLVATGASQDSLEQLKDSLTPLVDGLRRTGRLGAVQASFRDATSQSTKSIVREAVERAVPVMLSPEKRSTLVSLQDRLQALSASDFLKVLEAILIVSAQCLGHAASIKSAILDILAASRAPRTLQADAAQACTEAITAVSEAAHACWVRLLNARPAVPSRLQLAELEQMLAASDALSFVAEAAGAQPVHTARNAMQLQCKTFLEEMHAHSLTQLTGLLEQEQWTAALVARDFQRSIDSMERKAQAFLHANGNTNNAGLAHIVPASESGPAPKHLQNGGFSALDKGHMGSSDPAKAQAHLRVGGKDYHVVAAVLMMLGLIEGYLHFQEVVPVFTGEVAHRVVELLKVFNSRTCQLVLGAGALAAAGLRSITAKHLAMAAQCVGAIMGLHPALAAILTGPLPHSRRAILLPDFERLSQDLRIHRNEIHSKLVAIMRERLTTNLKQLPGTAAAWGTGAPGRKQPSAFAQTNAKQLRILCQVLSPLLLEEELHIIFGRVTNLFSKCLADAYARLEPLGPAWEAQCHADTHLMLSTLQSLPLDPKTAPSNMEHLANLCMLRFADPSPSGYTIPGQLPSPVSYNSASQASTVGTANSLALANGASPPSLGQQPEQAWQSQQGTRSTSSGPSSAQQQLSTQALQSIGPLGEQHAPSESAADRQLPTNSQLQAQGPAQVQAQGPALVLGLPTAILSNSAPDHAASASISMLPASNGAADTEAQAAEARMPAQLSLPSEEVLNSEGLTSASLDEAGGTTEQPARAASFRKLPSFALPDRVPTAQHSSKAALADSLEPQPRQDVSHSASGDPLGALAAADRLGEGRSVEQVATPGPSNTQSKSSAGSSPAYQQPSLDHQPAAAPQPDTVSSLSAAQPAQASSMESSRGREVATPPGDPAQHESGSSQAVLNTVAVGSSASADIRQLTREISELAYMDRDPVHGSPVRRYRGTDDAEEHFASVSAQDQTQSVATEALQEGGDALHAAEQQGGDEGQLSDFLAALEQNAEQAAAVQQTKHGTGELFTQESVS